VTRTALPWVVAALVLSAGAARAAYPSSAGTELVRVPLVVPAGNGGAPFDLRRTLLLPAGWKASVWARVEGARFAAWTPEGDLLVSVPDAGRIVRLQPRADAAAPPSRTVLASRLHDPQGLAFDSLDGKQVLYVAESDRLSRYAWNGPTGLGARVVVARGLPDADGVDRKKGIAVGPDHSIYVSVGGASARGGPRSVVLAFRPESGKARTFARGVRNGQGLSFDPDGNLWAAVHGRDGILYPFHRRYGRYADAFGKEIARYEATHPPDQLARLTPGRHLGSPACNPEPDVRPGEPNSPRRYANVPFTADAETNPNGKALDCRTLQPIEQTLSAHSAPLGLTFLQGSRLPAPWSQGAAVALHGSRDPNLRAPRVLWFRWDAGAHTLRGARPLAGGFQSANGVRWGRPVQAIAGPDGALYVTDDTAGAIYRLTPA
jgi:glucose/arabinose dehydrogenase